MFRSTLFIIAAAAAAPLLAQPTGITTVARATVVANAEAEFAKVDTNKDGQMTRAEIEAFQRTRAIATATARSTAAFAALDTDKNGQLSPSEFAKLNPGAPKVDATGVLRVDTNKDGKVSLAEHRAATLVTFDKLDANKDGILTAEEVRAAGPFAGTR